MLLMKAWLETRWRLMGMFVYLTICIAMTRHDPPNKTIVPLSMMLGLGAMMLAGSGVKSQSDIGFPEGLAGSTQYTIALPVSRLKLLFVRAAFGMVEVIGATLVAGLLAWRSMPPADLFRLFLIILVSVAVMYSASLFYSTFVPEPLSGLYAGWSVALLMWGAHHLAPAVDLVRVFGPASPLLMHSVPWSQCAVAVALAMAFFLASVRVVKTYEY